MEEMIPARRLREKHLPVRSDVLSPGIPAARGILLKGAAIRLEPHQAAAIRPKILLSIRRSHMPGAVPMRRINPAIQPPAQVVDHRMRVSRT